MSPNLASVLAAAESLSVEERRELVELLLDGLDEGPTSENGTEVSGLSEAWMKEIAQRSAEYDSGKIETVSWEEVKARWRARRVSGG